jgi:hypothetical protein
MRAARLLQRALAIIHRSLRSACHLNPRNRHPNTYQLLLDPARQPLLDPACLSLS